MKKILRTALFLAAAMMLLCVTALAADGEGIVDVATYNEAVTVTPLKADGTAADQNAAGVYEGAVKVKVTYSGAADGKYYLVLALTDGATVPTEASIAYIDQATGEATFMVYPAKLTSGQTYDVYLSSNDGSLSYTKVASFGYYMPYTLGDVNEDGNIDTVDAMCALQMSVGLYSETWTANQWLAANVDGSSTASNHGVDTIDAMLILQYAVGLIQEF